jgi:hypothetical protein
VSFVKKTPVRGYGPRPEFDIVAGIHHAGTGARRRLCAYVILAPHIMEEHGLKMGQRFTMLVGEGRHSGIIRIDSLAPASEHNLTLRREHPKTECGLVKSFQIPLQDPEAQAPKAACKFASPKKGIIDVKLPWDVYIPEELED